jgi:hypothetical protein
MRLPKSILLLLIAISIAGMAGCSTQPTPQPAPTIDIGALKEEIYKTVVAQLTVDAPKATPTVPATSTLAASPTVEILPSLTAPAAITLAPKSTFTAASSYTRYPTWTVTPYTDRASLSFQTPGDGTVMAPGEDFDVKWVIKNIGARDWTNEFYVTYISGIKSRTFSTLMLPPVHEGSETTILADYTAPSKPGNYVTQWALINDDGVKFFRFNFVFSVK